MAKIITVAVIKGGTGKTTTCAAIAQAGAHKGKKVLCIDLDAQGNLSACLGANTTLPGAFELLHDTPAKELIQSTEQGIDVIAASINLASETTKAGSIYRLQKAIEPITSKYNLIIIDTPPRLAEPTYNALQACNTVLIPLEADIHSLQGMYQLLEVVEQIKKTNNNLKVAGCIITRYNKRTKFNQYMRQEIDTIGKKVKCKLLAEIRQGIAIQEAQALQKSLYDYAPQSNPAIDYMSLYNQIIK